MQNNEKYWDTMMITYVLESKLFRLIPYIHENELILHLSSMLSILSMKRDSEIPCEDKMKYAESINRHSSILMVRIDNLIEKGYFLRDEQKNIRLNEENEFIQQFIKKHEDVIRYLLHPAYQIKTEQLSEMFGNMSLNENIILHMMKEESEWNIEKIYSLQSSTYENTYYNMYVHKNGQYSCVCPSFRYRCIKDGKIMQYCKHIDSYLEGKYSKKGDLEGYEGVESNGYVSLGNQMNMEKYKKEGMDTLFLECEDLKYIHQNTKYYGWLDMKGEDEVSSLREV